MMKSTFFGLSLAGAVIAQAVINTPAALVECQPASITFSGGIAPYFVSVIPGGQAGATPLLQFPEQQNTNPITWTVNIASGTSVTLQVTDGSGVPAYSSPVTIQNGISNSCLNGTATTSSATTSGATTSTTSLATTSTGSATTTSAVTTSSGTTTSKAPTTSASGTTSKPPATSGSSSGTSSSTSSKPSGSSGGSTSGASYLTAPLTFVLGVFALLA